MPGSKNVQVKSKISRETGDDSEDDSEILEESPCGRWLKRREEVQQRDIPGIDAAYLAMDTEEGVEVVWNEVQFSERKNFKLQEEKIRQLFDHLTQLDHPNIVKFHKYWIDNKTDKPRVIFITEYMSSGSLKQFLKKTKRNVIKLPIQAWKRWCTQILSALSYLHSCSPPVVHGNLTCDTIFIQHNGLVKIGSVAPDAIHRHVKTFRDDLINVHFIAPEFGSHDFSIITPAVDIYSFGMCALEIAALEISGNGETGTQVTEDVVNRTLESLENIEQRGFICECLNLDPLSRPNARELLFHKVIFEVHSLKLLSAHSIVRSAIYQPDQLTDKAFESRCVRDEEDLPIPEVVQADSNPRFSLSMKDAPKLELAKFLEDVRNGIYPLTSFACSQSSSPASLWTRAVSPEVVGQDSAGTSASPEPLDLETRRIIDMVCNIKQHEEMHHNLVMTLLLRLDDKMNRQLTCELSALDTPSILSEELVHFGFINQNDGDMVAGLIADTLSRRPPTMAAAQAVS